eukprot:89261-Amphidinium_carterae.1
MLERQARQRKVLIAPPICVHQAALPGNVMAQSRCSNVAAANVFNIILDVQVYWSVISFEVLVFSYSPTVNGKHVEHARIELRDDKWMS